MAKAMNASSVVSTRRRSSSRRRAYPHPRSTQRFPTTRRRTRRRIRAYVSCGSVVRLAAGRDESRLPGDVTPFKRRSRCRNPSPQHE
jgi:hypothetical protein